MPEKTMNATESTTRTVTRESEQSIENTVRDRYAKGAEVVEPDLCCPVATYESQYLKVLPQEIIDKDYGCGDPSVHAHPGDVVIDLGSGAGKVCYILSQKVGAAGRVIGLDFNDAMLSLARKYQHDLAASIGFSNVTFHKARIQDMALDLDAVAAWLCDNPINNVEQLDTYRAYCDDLRANRPLVADNSVDLIVSNCVLNLVRPDEKMKLFSEMHRVLKPGGRVVISDIVCDEDVTPAIENDAHLWSGCIAGAFREDRFPMMFEQAGFYGMEILKRQQEAWQTIEGIEFRAMTVRAYKGKEGPCMDCNQAVIYTGPWSQVCDDDGHTLQRGQRMAVCEKTYLTMTHANGPYAGQIIGVPPVEPIATDKATAFDCSRDSVRHPRETKGEQYRHTAKTDGSPCCDGQQEGDCC